MNNEKLPYLVEEELIKLKSQYKSLNELYLSDVEWLCNGLYFLKGKDLELAKWFNANTNLFEYAFVSGYFKDELDGNKHGFRVAMVQFTGNPKPYLFKTNINNLKRNDRVIVDTEQGQAFARFKKYVNAKRFDDGQLPSKQIIFRQGR